MTKGQLIALVAEKTGMTKKDAGQVAELIFEFVAAATKKTGRFSWPEFGVFSIRRRKARNVRNPKTGELMRLPSTETLGFKASKYQRRMGALQ